jgi:etoposide-induced 2.4 mRNA
MGVLLRIWFSVRCDLHMGKWTCKCCPFRIHVPRGTFHGLFPFLPCSSAADLFVYVQFIIMAMYARPVPKDPYNPAPSTESADTVRFPSPLVPIRMPVFAIVIWLNDLIVKVLSVGGSAGARHRRTPSETTEQAEEGVGVELRNISRAVPARGYPQAVQGRRLGDRLPSNGKVPGAERRKRD